MIVGHYATALVANKQYPLLPLWACMLAAIFLDIVMGGLLVAGVEHMTPANPDVPKLHQMTIDMTYSHDLLPVIGWFLLGALCGYALTRTWVGAAWLGGLVLLHEILDMLSGFYHYVFGPESGRIGLGLYEVAPLIAIAIELIVCLTCVWWFLRNTAAGPVRSVGLYGVMVIGCVVLLPMAT